MIQRFTVVAMIATAAFLSVLHLLLAAGKAPVGAAAAAAEKKVARGNVPRGVADAAAAAYDSSSGVFVCATPAQGAAQPKTLLYSYVNDNFCDCPDGSDEPGTSACAGLRQQSVSFYCRNEAFEGRQLALSRVGDGLCDCCDGSDESQGTCQDSCAELAAQAADADRARRAIFEAGAKERARWHSLAQEGLATERQELEKARQLLSTAASSKTGAETKAAAINAREADQKAAKRIEAQRAAEVRLGLHLLSHDRLLELVVELVRHSDSDSRTVTRVMELAEEKRDIDCNSTSAGCDPAVLDQDRAEDEQETQAAEAAEEAAQQAQANEEAAQATEEAGEEEDDEAADALPGIGEEEAAAEEESPEEVRVRRLRERIERGFGDADSFVLEEAETFRKTLSELEDSVSKLEKAVSEKELVVEKTDFGPDGVWFAIRDACFDTKLHGYSWELCPLKQMKQDSTSLGKFVRWENNYSTMIFEGGQRCWNGPERSAEIDLACGASSELVSMEEPSKCVYKGKFLTPLLCV